MESYGRKRNYSAYNSKPRHTTGDRAANTIGPGLRGFLCTCNFKEKDCIRESYNLLNEYADAAEEKVVQVDLPAPVKPKDSPDVEVNEGSDDGDIQSSLDKEIASLKSDAKKAPALRRFQVVDCKTKNCLFIRTTLQEPVKLVHSILVDLEATKKQRTRFLLRLLPIETTCKAYIEDIKEKADLLFEKYFSAEGKSFSILFNARNNKSVSRDKVIDELATMVTAKHPENKVDLKQPQLSVLVEIVRNICCLSVLPDYYRFRKYNLLEVSGGTEGKDIQGTSATGAGDGTLVPDDDEAVTPDDTTADCSDGTESMKKTKEEDCVDAAT